MYAMRNKEQEDVNNVNQQSETAPIQIDQDETDLTSANSGGQLAVAVDDLLGSNVIIMI